MNISVVQQMAEFGDDIYLHHPDVHDRLGDGANHHEHHRHPLRLRRLPQTRYGQHARRPSSAGCITTVWLTNICFVDVNWGASTQAQTYNTTLAAVQSLNNIDDHVKNYRPQILVLSGHPASRPALVDFANLVTKRLSLLMCGCVSPVRTTCCSINLKFQLILVRVFIFFWTDFFWTF